MVSPLPSFNTQSNTPSPQNTSCHTNHRNSSAENPTQPSQHQAASPPSTRGRKSNRSGPLPQKVALRKGKKDAQQTTLTQLCDGHLSDEADEEHLDEMYEEACGDKAGGNRLRVPKTPPLKTRVRSKRGKGATSSREKSGSRKKDPDQSTLTQFLADDETAAAVDASSEDGSSMHASPRQHAKRSSRARERQRGRQRPKGGTSAASDGIDDGMSASNESFRTPSQSPSSSQNRSGSLRSNRNKSSNSVSSLESTLNHPPISSHDATPRRRSAPSLLDETASHTDQPTSHNGRRSLPSSSTPSPTQRARCSPLFNTSPAKKSTGRKSRGRNSGQIKRNAKGETALHVAAIKVIFVCKALFF